MLRYYLSFAEKIFLMVKQFSKNNVSYQGQTSALDRLHKYSITGESQALRQQMLDDAFVLKNIALLGQWTTIFAAPGSGKTLLTMWLLIEALENNLLDGDNIFYINSDDNYRGIIEKTELAEKSGFHIIAPNQKGFNSSEIPNLMLQLAETGEAKGVVFVLDTLKKFLDIMQKKDATEFGIISRNFVSAGGTLICLAHTNKHAAADGRPIPGGTSDVRDDSDCVYLLNKITGQLYEEEVAVEFINDKSRGDVAEKVSFSYSRRYGQTYEELINTVKRIENDELEDLKQSKLNAQQLEADEEIISSVGNSIKAGITSKAAIIKFVNQETGITQRKISKVLGDRTGNIYRLGHRWSVETGAHNKNKYSLLKFESVTGSQKTE